MALPYTMHLIPRVVLHQAPMRRYHRGRGLSLRPINSVKEIVDSTLLGVAAGVNSVVTLGTAVNDYTGVVGTFPVGSKVSSVYYFVQIISATGTANVDFFVAKSPLALTAPVPGATGGNVFRKYILHEEKGLPGNAADGAAPLTFRGVIKIPRGRQRMAEGDIFFISLRGTDAHNICIKAIYKAYR